MPINRPRRDSDPIQRQSSFGGKPPSSVHPTGTPADQVTTTTAAITTSSGTVGSELDRAEAIAKELGGQGIAAPVLDEVGAAAYAQEAEHDVERVDTTGTLLGSTTCRMGGYIVEVTDEGSISIRRPSEPDRTSDLEKKEWVQIFLPIGEKPGRTPDGLAVFIVRVSQVQAEEHKPNDDSGGTAVTGGAPNPEVVSEPLNPTTDTTNLETTVNNV